MSQWKLDTWQVRVLFSCPNLDQMDWERKREGKKKNKPEERGKVWDF